ncbi:MAG: hypothetical protein PHO31_00635, partial [Candidatus Pacebacteria bacterium]|nr:hypothetical protein [Candidatus Paceibacterota bacterium]
SFEEFDSLMETLDILSDPTILDDIKKAEEEYKKGEYLTWEEVKGKLGFSANKEIFTLKEKPKKKYRAPRR